MIPSKIDGKEVSIIGNSAFLNNDVIEKVTVPKSVTEVKTNAFMYCAKLEEFAFSSTVDEIGTNVFMYCPALKNVIIPNSEASVGEKAFDGCPNVTIFCPSGSNAEAYAKSNVISHCTYKTDENDNVEITQFNSYGSTSINLVIPESIDEKNVTSIGDKAFERCTVLSSVKLPETIEKIGDKAFERCTVLSSIKLPETIEKIGDNAFDSCYNLTSIDIPKNVLTIGNEVFFGDQKLENVYIYSKSASFGENVFSETHNELVVHAYSGTNANNYADDNSLNFVPLDFNYSDDFTSVTEFIDTEGGVVTVPKKIMGKDVTAVADDTFKKSAVKTDISEINIPASVATLSGDVFDGLTGLSSINIDGKNSVYKSEEGILYSKDGKELIRCPEGYSDFEGSEDMTEFVLPDGVSVIGNGAFENVDGLNKFVVNQLVDSENQEIIISIGDDVFDGCDNLKNVTVYSKKLNFGDNSPITVEESKDVVIYGYLDSTAEKYAYDTKSKSEVPFVPLDFRFEEKNGEVTITGYDGDIEDLTLPTKINGKPVTALAKDGENPFFSGEKPEDESPLTSITIPKEITSVDPDVFDDLPNLENISVDDENPNYSDEDGVLFDNDGDELIRYPEGKKPDDGKYEVPDDVKKIGEGAFKDCDGLKEIDVPESVETIGDDAFENCPNLEKTLIYNPDVKIDGTPFGEDPNLTIYGYLGSTADDHAENNDIPFVPFDFRYNIVKDPETGEEEAVINGYDGDIKDLRIPDEIDGKPVKSLELGTDENGDAVPFFNGDGESPLEKIAVPEGIESINPDVFDSLPNLENIDVDDKNPNYSDKDGVLFDNDGDELIRYPEGKEDPEYKIPDNVKKIGDGAFEDCDNLEKVELPDSVEDIGEGAFEDCGKLNDINIPEKVTELKPDTFKGCDSLDSIEIPETVEKIGEDVFEDCPKLSDVFIYNPETEFEGTPFDGDYKPTIHGYLDSTAEDHAEENDLPFVPFDYRVENTDDGVIITGYEGSDEELKLPNEIAGKPVIGLGSDDKPFVDENSPVTSIVIPENVKNIDPEIFDDMPKLENIDVDDKNPNYSDDDGVLFDRDGDELLRYPEGKKPDDGKYEVPDDVKKIGEDAFKDCDGLKEIDVPESVETIGDDAFENCPNLDDVLIHNPETVFEGTPFTDKDEEKPTIHGYLGSTAEDHAEDNDIPFVPFEFRVEDTDDGVAVTGYEGDSDVIDIPEKIAGKPVTAVSADDEPFADETKPIKGVNIPEGIKEIDPGIFDSMPELENINVDDKNPNYSDDNGVLFDKEGDELLRYPEGKSDPEYTVPEGTEKIGDGAFKDCDDLKDITIPKGVTEIADDAFDNHNPDLTIYGYKDSAAEKFADEHDIPFVALDAQSDTDNTSTDGGNNTDTDNTSTDGGNNTDTDNTSTDGGDNTDTDNTSTDGVNNTDTDNTSTDGVNNTDTDDTSTDGGNNTDTDNTSTDGGDNTDTDNSSTDGDGDKDSDTDTSTESDGDKDSDTDTSTDSDGGKSSDTDPSTDADKDSDSDASTDDGSGNGSDSDTASDDSKNTDDTPDGSSDSDKDTSTDGGSGNDSDSDTASDDSKNTDDTPDGSSDSDKDTSTDGSSGNDSDTASDDSKNTDDTPDGSSDSDKDTSTDGDNGNDSDTDTSSDDGRNDSDSNTSTDSDGGKDSDSDKDGDTDTDSKDNTDTDGNGDGDGKDNTDTDDTPDGDDPKHTDDTPGKDDPKHTDDTPEDPMKKTYMMGDVDFDFIITSNDSLMILRNSIDLEKFDYIQNILADVNCDGVIDSYDAIETLRFSIDIPSDTKTGEDVEIEIMEK